MKKFIILIGLIIIQLICYSFVLLKMWQWFIYPITNIEINNIFQIMGILSIIQFLKVKIETTEKEINDLYTFIFIIVSSFSYLLIGYLIHILI